VDSALRKAVVWRRARAWDDDDDDDVSVTAANLVATAAAEGFQYNVRERFGYTHVVRETSVPLVLAAQHRRVS